MPWTAESRKKISDLNKLRITHGRTHTVEYSAWEGIKQRCQNPKNKKFHLYGGRGITLCERWQKFENFFEDMGPRPDGRMSIDRIDSNGNYEPGNCRWADFKAQARNLSRNRMLTFRGETLCVSEWCERLGVNRNRVNGRLRKGWSVEEALTKPSQSDRSKNSRVKRGSPCLLIKDQHQSLRAF